MSKVEVIYDLFMMILDRFYKALPLILFLHGYYPSPAFDTLLFTFK